MATPHKHAGHKHYLFWHVVIHHLPVPYKPLIKHGAIHHHPKPAGQNLPAGYTLQGTGTGTMTVESPGLVTMDHHARHDINVGTTQAHVHTLPQDYKLLPRQNHIPGNNPFLNQRKSHTAGKTSHVTHVVHCQSVTFGQQRMILQYGSTGFCLKRR